MDGRMNGWMVTKIKLLLPEKKVNRGESPQIDKYIIIQRNEERPKTKVISATLTKFI